MKPDELLDQLTRPDTGGIEALVAAAQARAKRRRALREIGAATIILLCILGGSILLLQPDKQSAQAPQPVVAPAPPAPLSGEELLDAFGDQPVALVTYPDGSQRLLTILRP